MRRRHMLLAPLTLVARPARAQTAEIDIDNFVFTPPSLAVARGTKVVWVNHDDIPHLVVDSSSPPAFRSKPLDTDERFENVFDTTGRFPYYCALHPHMQGVVIVHG